MSTDSAEAINASGSEELRATFGNEIERKLYTLAIGCLALGVMVFLVSNFLPDHSTQTLHRLLRIFRKAWVLANLETIWEDVVAVLVCLPLLKLTRIRLTWVDAFVLSAPCMYVHSLSLCDGFDARFLPPMIVLPFIFMGAFRLVRFIRVPSFVDDVPVTVSPINRTLLAGVASFQFSILCLLLAGIGFPFKWKLAFTIYLVGSCTSLYALLRPSIYSVLIAVVPTAVSVHLFVTALVPYVATHLENFSCGAAKS